jgi:hypothetical protein
MRSAVIYIGYKVCPRYLGDTQEQQDAGVHNVGSFFFSVISHYYKLITLLFYLSLNLVFKIASSVQINYGSFIFDLSLLVFWVYFTAATRYVNPVHTLDSDGLTQFQASRAQI